MSSDASSFPSCHSSIAHILACEKREPSKYASINKELEIHLDPKHVFLVDDLIPLAHECDQAIFEQHRSCGPSASPSFQALVQLGKTNDPSRITAAALIALNQLESSVRHTTGYKTGRAPLLKTMLSELDSNLSQVLQCLLLPTGLNLRNLLWHGFVGSIPRSWLALVLVLNENIKNSDCISLPAQEAITPLSQTHSDLARMVATGKKLRHEELESCKISNWLPQSHAGLWNLAVEWMSRRQYPAIVCVLLTILLEHGLRLDWCRLNSRMADIRARPHVFYITLDGHGQRHKHDMILHPYLSTGDGSKKNELINHVGGSTTALLTDLYASSCGGPNIRATLAHGTWDGYLQLELDRMMGESLESSGEAPLWEIVDGILVTMEQAAEPSKTLDYCPNFSYTATTIQSLERLRLVLSRLVQYGGNTTFETNKAVMDIPDFISKLLLSWSVVELHLDALLATLRPNATTVWTVEDVFTEHETNRRLAPLGATRTLLDDIIAAALSFEDSFHEAMRQLRERDDHQSRERRKLLRIVASRQVASAVYTFATLVALLSLKQGLEGFDTTPAQTALPDDTLLKAVKRTRMVVSTVATFLTTNADRAFKSINEYTKGKAIKEILMQNNAILSHPKHVD